MISIKQPLLFIIIFFHNQHYLNKQTSTEGQVVFACSVTFASMTTNLETGSRQLRHQCHYLITLVITGWLPKAERSHFLLSSPCIYDLSLVECKVPAIIGPVVFRKQWWFTIRKHQHQMSGKEHWKIETCCL